MKLWEKQKNFSHLQVLFGFSLFYVFCLYDNFSGVLYPVFLAGMLMLYQGLMKQAGRSIKKDSRLYMLAILLLGVSTFLTGNLIIICAISWPSGYYSAFCFCMTAMRIKTGRYFAMWAVYGIWQ